MSGEDLFKLVLFALFVVFRIVGALTKKKRTASTRIPEGGVEPETLVQVATTMSQRLSTLEARARLLMTNLETLGPDLVARLEPVIRTGALDQLEQSRREVEDLPDDVDPRAFQLHLRRLGERLTSVERLVSMLRTILDQRRDPEALASLGDADALAEACYRPIHDFVTQRGGVMTSTHPLTFFHHGATHIRLGFVPFELAPIALPYAYQREVWRWPAIAHEIAHDLFVTVEGLEAEIVDQLELDVEAESLQIGSEEFAVFLYRSWMAELFADAVGSLMVGPAYLAAMVTIFAHPGAPERVSTITILDDGSMEPHPPRHLRVHLTAHVLERMGHGKRAAELVGAWDEQHGPPTTVILRAGTRTLHLPLIPLLEFGRERIDRLYNAELATFAGHRLADIPGLEFGSREARRTEEARRRLVRGLPAAFDARALIAAATEASLDHPERLDRIRDAARRSIVGVGTDERAARVRDLAAGVSPYARPEQAATAPRPTPSTPRRRPTPAAPASSITVAPPMRKRTARARRAPDRVGAAAASWQPIADLSSSALIDALLIGEIIEGQGFERRRPRSQPRHSRHA